MVPDSPPVTNNPELLKLHKRLSIQSIVIENSRPMSTICQHLYTFGEEVYFTRMWDFTWREFVRYKYLHPHR